MDIKQSLKFGAAVGAFSFAVTAYGYDTVQRHDITPEYVHSLQQEGRYEGRTDTDIIEQLGDVAVTNSAEHGLYFGLGGFVMGTAVGLMQLKERKSATYYVSQHAAGTRKK